MQTVIVILAVMVGTLTFLLVEEHSWKSEYRKRCRETNEMLYALKKKVKEKFKINYVDIEETVKPEYTIKFYNKKGEEIK